MTKLLLLSSRMRCSQITSSYSTQEVGGSNDYLLVVVSRQSTEGGGGGNSQGEASHPPRAHGMKTRPRRVQRLEIGAILRVDCMDHCFLHSLNKYLMSFCYVPGMVLDTRDRAGKKTNFLPLWRGCSVGREGTQTSEWHVVVMSDKGKGREGDGGAANLSKWSRNIFLTRWQLNGVRRGVRAERLPVGRDSKEA